MNPAQKMQKPAGPSVERIEPRLLLSGSTGTFAGTTGAWLTQSVPVALVAVKLDSAGTLRVSGTDGDDSISISSDRIGRLIVDANSVVYRFDLSNIRKILISGQAGDDTILLDGGARKAYIDGGPGNDHLRGASYSDTLVGNLGNDTIYGGAGNDFIYGSVMEPDPSGEVELNHLRGEDGDDLLLDIGEGTFIGGRGRDTLQSTGGTFDGGPGADEMIIVPSDRSPVVTISYAYRVAPLTIAVDGSPSGEAGEQDTITAPPETRFILRGGKGDDIIRGGQSFNTILGGSGNDLIYGGPKRDEIFGHDGDDTIDSGRGEDVITGGGGIDTITYARYRSDPELYGVFVAPARFVTGNERWTDRDVLGDDVEIIIGSARRDSIIPNGLGSHWIDTRDGADTIVATGKDTIFAGAGNDEIIGGGPFALEIYGGDGDDSIQGGSADDMLFGDSGDDIIDGFAGNDTITGGPGRDSLYGWEGDDLLVARDGEIDLLFGNAGTDTAEADDQDILLTIENA